MPTLFIKLLLPYAIDAIKAYIKNSDSDKDDKVLDLVQNGCEYLAKKDNNTVNFGHSSVMYAQKMTEEFNYGS